MLLNNLFDVSGKVAIVTGGSRGIGEMIAEGLVRNGVKVYISARKAEACDATAARLNEIEGGGGCVSIPADLATDEGLAAFVEAFSAQEDSLDILVNNAGAAWGAEFGEFPGSGFDKVLAINVKAPFMLSQALVGHLKKSATAEDPSRIIMIGSIDGIRVPVGEQYSYGASKAGIHMMGRHMAKTLVADNITVNSIAPGPFQSKMMAFMLDDPASREMVEKSVPRQRIGSPEDVAGTVIFLASRAGAYLTGATIPLDGGTASLAG